MIRKTILWISAITATAAMALSTGQNPPAQDPGQLILNRACTVCHNLSEITKFKGYYGKDQWADVVRTMRADGAQVQDGEVTALVEYLFKTYGKVELPEGDGRRILETSCDGCHDLQKATSLKLSKSGWQDLVVRMIGSGAKVDDAQVPTLVDYLTKNFGASQ
jgi:cytochrome c5